MKFKALKVVGCVVVASAALTLTTCAIQIAAYLDGMKAGRATLFVSAAAKSVRSKPYPLWAADERESMAWALKLALKEADGSTSAMEYLERYVQELGMGGKTLRLVHHLRCETAETESAVTRIPRQVTRLILRDKAGRNLAPCAAGSMPAPPASEEDGA